MNQDNMIVIARSVMDLKGIGTEYLVVDGVVIAKFYNGSLIVSNNVPVGNDEPTLKVA